MSKKDTTWKNHKYVRKVRGKNGRWRYIYDPNPGNDSVLDYDLDQALYDIQSMPDGKEKDAAMTDWYKKKQFIESDIQMGSIGCEEPYLEHYGVLGMKWGVRRGRADQALGKTVKQLGRWDKKGSRARARMSAKEEARAAKMDRKAARLNYRASKIDRKVNRYKAKSARSLFKPNAGKARKMFRKEVKSQRMKDKAIKLQERSSKIKARQAKAKATYEKYQKKSAKLATAAVKEFSNVNIKDLNKENYAALEKYASRYTN